MNQATNSNGNGENGQQLRQLKKIAQSEAASNPSGVKESLVTFQTADGLELRGIPTRVTRHTVVFELYNPSVTPRLSEVLSRIQNRPAGSNNLFRIAPLSATWWMRV